MSNNNDRYEEIKTNAERVASDILTLTRNGLFVTLRFLDVALCQFNFLGDESVEKLSTTGQTLIFNTKYVISRYLKEKQVLSHDYLHIVMHCIFRHPFVSDKLERQYWDLAADIAVEAIISDLEVKQAETDDMIDINDALKEIGEKAGKLTAERIYNFLLEGGLSQREIDRYKKIFFRDEHDIWWELARKLREEAEKEAEEEAQNDKSSDADESDGEKPEGEEESDETEESEEQEDEENDGGEEAEDNLDDEDEENDMEEQSDGEGESESDDSEEEPGEDENSDNAENDSDEDEEDDEPDTEFVTGSDHPDDEEGEQSEGAENPEGGDSMDRRDDDGTKDESEGESGENRDAESERGSDGRTGSGENEGTEDSEGPDEGGSMQQGSSEPRIGDMPDEKQPQSTRNKSNAKKNTAAQEDQSGSSGSGGGDSVQAGWQHQSGGGAKKGSGGGEESETRPELEGEHKSAGMGGEDAAEKDERGERSREKKPSDDGDSKYSQEKLDELEKKWREISERLLVDLETSSKEWGDKSDAMLQSLKNINRDRFDYTTFLKKFAVFREDIQINPDEFDYVYYTYGLEHYGNMPLVEPLEYREVKKINEFVIAIDTSGSCSGEVVQKFLDKTYSILTQQENFFRKINVHIIQCDAEIQEAVKITSKDEFEDYLKNLNFKGFGGTDFRPVFEYVNYMIEEGEFRDLKGLIYFTDGNGTYPLKRPKYETAFVFVDDNEFEYEVPSWAIKLVLETSDILEEDKVKVNHEY